MRKKIPTYKTLNDWMKQEALPFSLESVHFNKTVDTLMDSLGSVKLLGFGEALHGGEEILRLRNRLFQRLVEAYGFSAIALESSFPRAHITNEYVSGRGPKSYQELLDVGFGQGVGQLEANRELVEWMKEYNASPTHLTKLRFYGLDIPTGTVSIASPRQVLHFVLDYLASFDKERTEEQRVGIEELLGQDADWENPEAHMDPTKSIGLSPNATALRIETEDLISELQARRPELIAKSDRDSFLEALQHARVARGLLNFHASMARASSPYAERLGIRDMLQADNLLYMISREENRGKVFAFAHNSHLKRGTAEWQLGPDLVTWWPAGSQLSEIAGEGYAVIGSGLGVSEENGIGKPEEGALESRLTATDGPIRFIPTYRGKGLPTSEIASLPIRSGSEKNPTYLPFTPQSFTDFDWLVIFDSTSYTRGGPSLQEWDTGSE